MNAKVKAILRAYSVIFIAFRLSLTLVDAELPSADLMSATTCLKEFFAQLEITHRYSFLASNDSLNNGEYLGVFCSNKDPEKLKEEISKKDPKSSYNGAEIEKCLEKSGKNKNIFEEFRYKGISSSALEEWPNNTPIFQFIKGVCKFEEFSDFEKLPGEDKVGTLQCSEKCLEKFFERVEDVVIHSNNLWIFNAEERLEEEEKRVRKKFVDKTDYGDYFDRKIREIEEKYKRKIKKVNEKNVDRGKAAEFDEELSERRQRLRQETRTGLEIEQQIDTLTTLGEEYLKYYGRIYYDVNNRLTEEDIKEDDFLRNLDRYLFDIFSLYKNCTKRGCGMSPTNSIPLYTLIEKRSKDSSIKAVFGRYITFYKALWKGERNMKDTHSDSAEVKSG